MRNANHFRSVFILLFSLTVLISACGKEQETAFQEEYFPEASLSESTGLHETGFMNAGDLDQTPEIFVQMGHISGSFSYTNALAFLHDGAYILSGSGDGTVKLWETATGREVKTFRCNDDVTHIDISRDGRYLVTGDMSHFNNIHLWDIATGDKIRSFRHDNINGPPVVFCNNDTHILSGGNNETLKLWKIDSGELIREFAADSGDASPKPGVTSIVMTGDGESAIVGYRYSGQEETDGGYRDVTARDDTIRVWNPAVGEELLSFNRAGWVTVLRLTPDGRQILSGDYRDDSVRLWDVGTGLQTGTYPGPVSSIDISAGGRYALLGGPMQFSLVETASGKVIRHIYQGLDGWVRSIRFSPDGSRALVGDDSSRPKLWDLATGSIITEYGGYAGQLRTLKLSRTGKTMLTADTYNNIVNLWDYGSGRLIKTITPDSQSIMSSATLSADGKLMATGGWSRNSRTSNAIVRDVATSEPVTRLKLESESGAHTEFLRITADNRYLIWATREHLIISDLRSGEKVGQISDSSLYPLEQLSVDPDGRYIIAPSHAGTKLFSIPNGDFVRFLSTGEEVGCVSGREAIYEFTSVRNTEGRRERFLTVYDRATLKEKTRNKTGDVYFNFGVDAPPDFLYLVRKDEISRYDLSRHEFTAAFSGHTDQISGLETTPDKKFICSSSSDGTTRFWSPETGREVARFISFSNGEWIVITPEGYFNASPDGARYLNVRVGNSVYPIDNFYERFFNPVHVAAVLQGKKVEAVADIRQGVAPPPEVRIISPEAGTTFSADTITVTVTAGDTGGGIDGIRLYHNGKAVGEERRAVVVAPKAGESAKTYQVNLVDGSNTFRAVGFSRDRTESNPYELAVTLAAPARDVSLYVLAVGINQYRNPALNLNYAEPDARGISGFFRKSGKGLFKNVETMELFNEDATRENIVSKLRQLQTTGPQDAVLIYLAGHGETIADTWYFLPHELTYPERPEDVKAKGLSSEDLSAAMKNIPAQKILVLVDACKSGAVLVAFRGFEDRKALAQLSRSAGIHVIAASTKDQFAAEVRDLGHGLFTYTLLD